MARLPGSPPFLPPASPRPGPTYPTGAFSGEFIHASRWLSPPLLSKHDHCALKVILLGRHPSVPTLLITAPNCLLSYLGQLQAYRICGSTGSLSRQLLSIHI